MATSTLPAERLGTALPREFYDRDPRRVCRELLGKVLVRNQPRNYLAARIVEVEAYFGKTDGAAHSFAGRTARNAVLFGPPGFAYVYFIYGNHYCLNVACLPDGVAGGILFRAAEPLAGTKAMAKARSLILNGERDLRNLTSGPGRLAEAFGITRERDNGKDLTSAKSDLFIADDAFRVRKVLATPRIGITKAAERPWRYMIAGNPFVSGPKNLRSSGSVLIRENPRPVFPLCTSVSSVVYCLFCMKPDYGIDAPGVVRNLFVIGALLLVLGFLFPVIKIGPVIFLWKSGALVTGILCLIEGVLMVVYAKHGKFLHRDRMLGMVDWKGNESVLDVGTGRGLLMIGAAKKLTACKSVGIDIWSTKDLSGNAMEKTLQNADIEGVRDKVEVQIGDASAMKFPDASFDVVVSNLCIHNIPTRKGRDQACREIVRVLKPGGKAIISDFIKTGDYVKAFKGAGAVASRTGLDFLRTFPPLRIVEVRKPPA